ncbi:amidase signature domain-containing protein [Apiospora arundinis]|uniref:IBR finger domain protein n=1 Tax=Apiospora arundinis TaxID=335852 RepID=A0ABR2JHE4_9PEZI
MPPQRTVLITGCSDHSLGAALALAFHKTGGWRVIASARNPAKLKQVADAGITTVQLDITSEESIAASVAVVEKLTSDGSLDALVNNAGAAYSLPLLDIDLDKARALFDLNVFAILRVTRAFMPLLMKSSKTGSGGGLLVNNTSAASQPAGAFPFQGAYNASKAAAASLTEGLRLELAPFGIRVVNLVTGGVKSGFFDNAPTATLPRDSLYNVAKEAIETVMAGEDMAAQGQEASVWADAVVRDLSCARPAHWVWRGRHATEVRLASLLPVGTLDGVIKKMSKLDVLEQKIKEKGSKQE